MDGLFPVPVTATWILVIQHRRKSREWKSICIADFHRRSSSKLSHLCGKLLLFIHLASWCTAWLESIGFVEIWSKPTLEGGSYGPSLGNVLPYRYSYCSERLHRQPRVHAPLRDTIELQVCPIVNGDQFASMPA